MLKIYKHEGVGYYIGSYVIIISSDRKTAEYKIREILDGEGLYNEKLNITEYDIKDNSTILIVNGDY